MTNRKIVIGGDHAGLDYKNVIVHFLKGGGYEVIDKGPYSNGSVDYPDFAHPVSEAVEKKEADFGILICGSGNGVAITANKHQGVRAALCWLPELAMLARQHNNANVLCLPARFVTADAAKKMVSIFLDTDFEGGRHETRVGKISC